MGKDYKALFIQSENIELPQGLLGSVLVCVRLEQKKSARRELIFVGSTAVGSLIAIIPVSFYFLTSFFQSSFYQYLSLAWSEGSGVLAFWKEISMSLAESLPIFSIVTLLFILVVLLWSVARTTRDIKICFLTA
jgi:hypothetical protein